MGNESSIKIFYQKAHGFITYGSLSSKNPILNITKVLEFQAYIATNKPDVIVLSETWLKPSISDAEIFTNDNYKIFRLDHSPDSHPPDPNNRNKFKLNSGVVLIAANNNLDINPKLLKSRSYNISLLLGRK